MPLEIIITLIIVFAAFLVSGIRYMKIKYKNK